MRSIALLTQKGGAGKTTLAALLAVAASEAGENVIALDLDPQASLSRWAERRATARVTNKIMVEPLERDRLARLPEILIGLAGVGFTLAIFDTAGADSRIIKQVADAVDICLLPARPTRLDVEATAATFRAVFLAKRRAAFVLNQCPSNHRSSRASDAARGLTGLGVLAEPLLSARMDYQDAIAAGLGIGEFARGGRASDEIATLWRWVRAQIGRRDMEPANDPAGRKAAA